jgi:peroxiredoxin
VYRFQKRSLIVRNVLTAVFFVLAGIADVLCEEPRGERKVETPTAQYQAIQKETEKVESDYRQALTKAESEKERKRIRWEYVRQMRMLATRVLALAGPNVAETCAADITVIQCDLLLDMCRDAEDTIGIGTLPSEQFLRAVIEKSAHRAARGIAMLCLAGLLEDRAKLIREVDQRRGMSPPPYIDAEGWKRLTVRRPDDLMKESSELFERMVQCYSDLDTLRKVPLGKIAEGRLSRQRSISVGKPAPEIEGADVDGKTFRLSDYRGKVVLLTFSGNWCGSCRAFYEKERELIERLKGKRFVVLSVNTDKQSETLRKSLESGETPWRCWWDQGTGGPITLKWGIYYFPTVYLIDCKGMIRYEEVFGEEIDDALKTLLEEADRTQNN